MCAYETTIQESTEDIRVPKHWSESSDRAGKSSCDHKAYEPMVSRCGTIIKIVYKNIRRLTVIMFYMFEEVEKNLTCNIEKK